VDVNGGLPPPLDEPGGLPPCIPLTKKDLFAGVVTTLVAFLAVLLVPVAGMFISIFVPLPTLLSVYRFGHPAGYWIPGSVLMLGVPLLLALGAAVDSPYLAVLLLLGGLVGEGMRRRWSMDKTMGIAAGVAFWGGAMAFWAVNDALNAQYWSSLEAELRKSVEAALQVYRNAGVEFDQQATLDAIQKMIPRLIRMLPGATFVLILLITWLNTLVAHRFCTVRGIPLPAWPPWSHWKAPEPLVWLVIAAGTLLLLPFDGLALVAANLLLGLGAIYLFQGLAIAVFYLHRWNVPRLLRGMIYVLLLVQQFAPLLLMLLGLFDMWFNFRRLPPSGIQPNVPEAS
jgi:uncharacterized protein YybS (DUF2232 family)